MRRKATDVIGVDLRSTIDGQGGGNGRRLRCLISIGGSVAEEVENLQEEVVGLSQWWMLCVDASVEVEEEKEKRNKMCWARTWAW